MGLNHIAKSITRCIKFGKLYYLSKPHPAYLKKSKQPHERLIKCLLFPHEFLIFKGNK